MCNASERESVSVINIEQFTSILEVSEEQAKADLGSALLYRVKHPELGNIVLVNTAGERHGLVKID